MSFGTALFYVHLIPQCAVHGPRRPSPIWSLKGRCWRASSRSATRKAVLHSQCPFPWCGRFWSLKAGYQPMFGASGFVLSKFCSVLRIDHNKTLGLWWPLIQLSYQEFLTVLEPINARFSGGRDSGGCSKAHCGWLRSIHSLRKVDCQGGGWTCEDHMMICLQCWKQCF